MSHRFWSPFVLVAALAVAAPALLADTVLLEDGNSMALFELEGDGNTAWNVDGVDHTYIQWFFYRLGRDPEQSISMLTLVDHAALDTNPFTDPRLDTLVALYRSPGLLEIETIFKLLGGAPGSRQSDMLENITIRNLSDRSLSVSFFQYADFDLSETIGDDTVWMPFPNTAQQWDPYATVSETVVTPLPTRRQVAYYSTLFDLLTDNKADDLNGDVGPLGPGDVTWAFQWDFEIPAGGSVLISKNKHIIPEPMTLALLTAGLGFAGLRRRRA